MQNSNLNDGTNVPASTNAEDTTSSQTIAKPTVMRRHNWECNACGFSEYTDAISQYDLDNWLQCSNCGDNEFHLVPVFDGA